MGERYLCRIVNLCLTSGSGVILSELEQGRASSFFCLRIVFLDVTALGDRRESTLHSVLEARDAGWLHHLKPVDRVSLSAWRLERWCWWTAHLSYLHKYEREA